MRPALLLLSLAVLLSACPGPGRPARVGPKQEAPSFRTLKVGIAPEAAFETIVATLGEAKIPTEAVSKEGGVVRSAWVDGLRFDIHVLGTVCTLEGESKERGHALNAAEVARLDAIAAKLEAALGSASAEVRPPATPAPTPLATTPMEAARRAIEKTGLKIERTLESSGRIETSWNASEFAAVNISDQLIEYRVRYIVQVTGRTASARSEIEKSNDHRSWLSRAKMTKKEEETLEKLRRALHEELDALPPE